MSVALQMVLVAQGMYFSPLPPGFMVSSRADCVSTCYFNSTCSSIFYESSTNMCHLVDTVYLDAERTVAAANMQYLAWTTDSCGAAYTWYRALNLCINLYTTPKTWQDADSHCIQDGGNLMKVTSDAINTLMNRFQDNTGTSFWLGGNDINEEGTWLWADNSPIQNSFWSLGQPNVPTLGEDCLLLYAEEIFSPGRWHDDACSSAWQFLCQIPVPAQPFTCTD